MRIHHFLSSTYHPNRNFWVSLLTLNCLLFLPLYALNTDSVTFLPAISGDDCSAWSACLLRWRDNYDLFRLNVELILLVNLWVFVRSFRVSVIRWMLLVLFLVAFIYYVYEATTITLYQVEPVFYVQYFLFADGIHFLLENLNLSSAVIAASAGGVVVLGFLITILVLTTFSKETAERLHPFSKTSLALLLAASLIAVAMQRETAADPGAVVSSLTYKMSANVAASLAVHDDVLAFDDAPVRRIYDYDEHVLAERPDIYLIFVESYGSVLYKRDDFKAAYLQLSDELDQQLESAGWLTTSALSEAPTWGGGSWMSYASALFGMRIDSHPQFLSLFNKYQIDDYPDLGRYLRSQGYEYVRLSSISSELKEHEWLRYRNFYGVDRWLRHRDLDYVGPRYGWGPAPPDQYALAFSQEKLDGESERPRFFFTITQNSHYPWDPMPAISDDWRSLNQPGPDPEAMPQELIAHATRRQNYFNAIEYQLRFLTKQIIDSGDEDAIYILVGDHQPPRVSRRSDGWDTPIHLIARDPKLIDRFSEFGFNSGLRSRSEAPVMHHEGLYSMLVRSLVATYGEWPGNLPEYLPNGATTGARIATR